MHHKPKMTITHSLVDFDATFHTRTHENVWNNHWTCINNFSLLSRLNQGHFGIEKTRHCLPTHQYPNWKRSAIKIISVECFMIIKIARIRVHDEWTFRFDCRTAALVLETCGVCCCCFSCLVLGARVDFQPIVVIYVVCFSIFILSKMLSSLLSSWNLFFFQVFYVYRARPETFRAMFFTKLKCESTQHTYRFLPLFGMFLFCFVVRMRIEANEWTRSRAPHITSINFNEMRTIEIP